MTCPDSQFCVSYVPNCGQPPCARIGSCVTSGMSPVLCNAVCRQCTAIYDVLRYTSQKYVCTCVRIYVCTRGRVYVDLRNVIHIPGAINRLLLHRVGAIQMNKH